MDRRFEKRVEEKLGFAPVETRLLLKIADGLTAEMKMGLRGTALANDMDALLVLTRLDAWEQGAFLICLGEGMDPHEGVELVSQGEFQRLIAVERRGA